MSIALIIKRSTDVLFTDTEGDVVMAAPAGVRFSLFRILLGDFDVTLMNDANPVLCPLFFFLFVFVVFFVLLNMFLAIIIHAYLAVKEESAKLGQDLTLATYLQAVLIDLRQSRFARTRLRARAGLKSEVKPVH